MNENSEGTEPGAPRGGERWRRVTGLSHHLAEGAGAGRREARKVFKRSLPRLEDAVRGAAHDVGYGVAFAATYGFLLGSELAPRAWREGVARGVEKGRRAVASRRGAAGKPEGPASAATGG